MERLRSRVSGCDAGELTNNVSNGKCASPRRWKPHAASAADRTNAATSRDDFPARSNHDIDQPPRDHDDLLRPRAVRVLGELRARHRRAFDRCLIGNRGYSKLAAELAVDLKNELDFVLRERGGVDCWPGPIEDVAMADGKTELLPQHVSRVR